ncbi:hypothetical protein M0R45_012007 [Rubus argutus]|uniref:Patatin n=1 Tax=Rubus argutus TaxID=59490 RepID=A0AAW1YBG9_RUBAR
MERTKSIPLQPPTYGNLITVLSIDGGGIRGTSTGGLVTAMLTTPDENNRPLFAAKDIKDFYLNHGPKIFPQNPWSPFPHVIKIIKSLVGPKYDGKYLHRLVRERLGDKKLHQTLTNVVIPTFDIKNLQPTIFSSFEIKKKPSFDALLSDISIATSAAPTYFPAHYFETEDAEGKVREFNLVDGGVAANNPTLVAIGEVTKEIIKGSSDFFPIKPMDYGSGGSTPIINIYTHGSADMVDLHLSVVFQALHSEKNYLRIQDDTLSGQVSSVDIATKKNLNDLVEVGEGLLKKPVSRVNLENGRFEASNHETNEEGSYKKWLRLARSPHGKCAMLSSS